MDNSFNYSNKLTNDHYSPYHLPHTVPIPPPPFPPHYYYDWQMYDPQTNPYWGYYYNQYQGFDPNYYGPPQMPPHYQQQMPPPQSNGQPMPPPMPGNYFYGYPPPPPMPPYCYYNYHRPMSSRETTPCFSENERSLKTPTNEDRNRRAVSCTPTCCNHAKSFVIDDTRRQSFTMEEPNMKLQTPIQNQKIMKIIKPVQYLTSDESSDNEENFNRLDYDSSLRRSLKSVPSVTNINLYNEDNSDFHLEELQAKPIIEEEDDDKSEEEEEDEEDTTEVFEDISEDTESADLHFPHQLSIIYEENDESANRSRRSSMISRCSTLSDCSTTLMEEDNISIDGSGDELNDDEEENSVTVRLPLKFSFTRSKDNLVNTTLVVGESEHSDNSSSSISIKAPTVRKSLTPPSSTPTPPTPTPLSNNNSASDVSVTFRLPSKSKSRTPERGLLAPMRTLSNTNSMDSDSDLSVSISLPRKLNRSSKSPSWSEIKEETAPNSNENKKHIDNHLNESIDAFEEIKREMEEITYSLCSRICSMRKSTINVPNHENRSSSTSQIDDIDTDSETDISFSLNDCRDTFESQQDILGINEEMPDEEVVDEEVNDPYKTVEIKINAADGMDFWSEISSANKKFTELDSQPISKTLTRSSQKFWFDDEEEVEDEKPAELEEVVNKLEKNESVDNENHTENDTENDTDFWASNTKFETGLRESISFQNGTENQTDENDLKDENEKDIVLADEEYDESSEYESDPEDEEDFQTPVVVPNIIKIQESVLLKKEDESPPKPQLVVKKEESSETEWTEEEVDETEDEEVEPPKKIELPKPKVVVMKTIVEKSKPLPPPPVESETEYEETEYEEETEDEEEKPEVKNSVVAKPAPPNIVVAKTIAKMIVKTEEPKPTVIKEVIKPVEVEETEEEEGEESEVESEESEDEEPRKERSSSMISKGKSLVDVNAYIKYEGKKAPVTVNNPEQNDESEYSSAEEPEEEINEISNHQSKHSNDEYDDCQTLTQPQAIDVFLPSLTAISSFDSKSNIQSESGISIDGKSNMKSESGISCLTESNNGQESEDGYEEDSDDEVIQKDEKIIKINESVVTKTENEIKINVKNKISMFECPKIEENIIVPMKERDVPRVPAKYSFKYRESSEPPAQLSLKCLEVPKSSPRAVSEVKEVVKNQRLIDMINQRKSLPPVPVNKRDNEERKSVKERISTFESTESDASERRETFKRYGNSKKSIPAVRSIDSAEEDSGVTSDFCRQFSENETDSENFPELRKMSRYQRASTHSRLFKLLQDDEEEEGDEGNSELTEPMIETPPQKPKKIIHNVSVTRRNNAAQNAETMEDRRKRLCLPLQGSSSGAESMSSSTTPSPTPGHVNEKLVNELVQSLLLQKKGKLFRNLPVEKLHAAAVKILQEDMESTGTLSSADESTIPTVDSTPALTPQEFRNNSSYSEYYDSWANADELSAEQPVIQSKAFKNLQDQQNINNKKVWSVRCPRILSSKSINKDLARLSEVRESESPEPSYSNSRSPSIRSLSNEPMSGEINSIRERLSARKCNT